MHATQHSVYDNGAVPYEERTCLDRQGGDVIDFNADNCIDVVACRPQDDFWVRHALLCSPLPSCACFISPVPACSLARCPSDAILPWQR